MKSTYYTRAMISRSVIWSLCIVMVSFLYFSCGSGGGGSTGGVTTSGSTGQSSQGITECYGCHADGMIQKYAGQQIFSLWRNGPHGNYEGLYHADNGMNNEGFPSYGYNGLGNDPVCTTVCHDQIGDGQLLADYYLETGITFLGIVNRPVIGCESCHGSGSSHYGIGPMPHPNPDPERCGQCHNDQLDQVGVHITYYPESDNIYADYQSSPHAGSINNRNYVTGSTTDVKAICSKCHTDEGAKLYKDLQGGYDGTPTNPGLSILIPGSEPAVANASVVQCRTCHDAHNPGRLLRPASSGNSSEYQTCTNCHQYILDLNSEDDGYHGPHSPYSWSGYAVGVGTFDSGRTIYDTHFDDSTTTDIEGYVLDPSSDRACRDCHNQHNANNTIHLDWANSAHGGYILQTVRDPVTHKYKVTDAEGSAWVSNDFKSHPSRDACQRCHTATGFKNLADDPAGYDPANNTFVATGEQREMLFCWACHTSNAGALRDPGVFSNVSPFASPAVRISGVPDLNGSNICMSCHSGRQSGQGIKDKDYATEIVGNHFGGFSSHNLAAGGILFRTIGYEFGGLDYSNVIAFAHDLIGTTGDPDMGSNGPCVGCHMKTANAHTFANVTKGAGLVTDITAYNPVCSNCHANEATLVTTLNNLDAGYDASLDEIVTLLAAQGIYYGNSYPYFFNVAAPQIFPNAFTAWPNKDTLGAAFNVKLLKELPGAYAHNYEYTRRLIYDTIDFLDDGILNQSIAATLAPGPALTFLGGGPRP